MKIAFEKMVRTTPLEARIMSVAVTSLSQRAVAAELSTTTSAVAGAIFRLRHRGGYVFVAGCSDQFIAAGTDRTALAFRTSNILNAWLPVGEEPYSLAECMNMIFIAAVEDVVGRRGNLGGGAVANTN
jgi:hypothetical protein